jgi:hypothetical protein
LDNFLDPSPFVFIIAPSSTVWPANDQHASEGAAFARQPRCHIPLARDLGRWLCVPPFRVVCLYQAIKESTEQCLQKWVAKEVPAWPGKGHAGHQFDLKRNTFKWA